MNILRLNTLNDDKVIVRGNGGNGGGDASTIEYVDISVTNDTAKYNIVLFSILARVKLQDTIGVIPSGFTIEIEVPINNMLAVCMDTNMLILGQNGLITIKDSLIENGWWETYSSLPRITKEEFYHIPKIVNIDSMSSDEIKVVFEDLYSQLSLKYNIGDTFDDELSLYGYKEIILSGNSLTKVGQICSFSEDDILIRLGSEEIPYSQGWGLMRSKVDGDIFYNPHFPG